MLIFWSGFLRELEKVKVNQFILATTHNPKDKELIKIGKK